MMMIVKIALGKGVAVSFYIYVCGEEHNIIFPHISNSGANFVLSLT